MNNMQNLTNAMTIIDAKRLANSPEIGSKDMDFVTAITNRYCVA